MSCGCEIYKEASTYTNSISQLVKLERLKSLALKEFALHTFVEPRLHIQVRVPLSLPSIHTQLAHITGADVSEALNKLSIQLIEVIYLKLSIGNSTNFFISRK